MWQTSLPFLPQQETVHPFWKRAPLPPLTNLMPHISGIYFAWYFPARQHCAHTDRLSPATYTITLLYGTRQFRRCWCGRRHHSMFYLTLHWHRETLTFMVTRVIYLHLDTAEAAEGNVQQRGIRSRTLGLLSVLMCWPFFPRRRLV